jgi:dTDP-4-amino-4,6-dideoxygalactose transaminase
MQVAFADLSLAHKTIQSDIDNAIAKVLASGQYIGGAVVTQFESDWATYCGSAYCVGAGNGMDAIEMCLRALGVKPGDDVLVPAWTYIATWLAVSRLGANPVPVASCLDSGLIDVDALERSLTPTTTALLVVHLYGQAVDLDACADFCKRHGLPLIEDAAQAHGARWKGRRIGAHGDAVAWSFYPGKNLGAIGDAGGITCSSGALAEQLRLLGNYGSRQKYEHETFGFNSRLDPIQAGVLSAKLRHLDAWNDLRVQQAQRYARFIAQYPKRQVRGLTIHPHAQCVWHQFVVLHPQRDQFRAALAERGIETLMHYPKAPFQQQAYAAMQVSDAIGASSIEFAAQALSLPMGLHVTESHWEHLEAALASALHACE